MRVNGAPVVKLLSLLLGPPNGELLPSRLHAATIGSGDVVAFEAGLEFLQRPQDLGIGSGDSITFTALFKAAAPIPIRAPTPTPAPVATPTPTGAPPALVTSTTRTLTVAFGPPISETLVPWLGGDIAYKRPLFESLGGLDRFTGQPEPQLATEWSLSADALRWTFKLRKGVPFHFGWGEITSRDWAHAIAMSTSIRSVDAARPVHQSLAAVETPDDYTLVLVQSRPDIFEIPLYHFGTRGSTVGVSKAYWDASGLEGYKVKAVGTGPYQFVTHAPGAGVTYERVLGHWRKPPEFQEIQQFFTAEAATRTAMMLAGDAHIVAVPRDREPILEARGMRVDRSVLPAFIYGFHFGGSHFEYDKLVAGGYDMAATNYQTYPKVIDDAYLEVSPWTYHETGILVRVAINRAIDREVIRATLFRGQGEFMKVFGFHPTVPGWNPQWDVDFDARYGYDPERARDLLAEAGWPNGFPVKITAFDHPSVPESIDTIEVIAIYLQAIGLTVTLEQTPFSVRLQLQRERALQGQIAPFIGRYRDVQLTARAYYAQPGGASVWENLFTWQTYDQMRTATNFVERDWIIRELGDHLFYSYAGIPLLNIQASAVVDPAVVAQYAYPGNTRDLYTHLEYVQAANVLR